MATSAKILPVKTFVGHENNIRSIAFMHDGKRALSASWDGTVRIWDIEKGVACGEPLIRFSSYMLTVKVSPDGTRIASGGGNVVFISDAATSQKVVGPLRGHGSWVNDLCFSPDGTKLASASDDRTIVVWDTKTGIMVAGPFKVHVAQVRSVAFSPDGERILTSSNDNTIQIRDAKRGELLVQPINAHNGGVTCALWLDGNEKIISSSFDETIGIWDAETGEQIGKSCEGHKAPVWSLAIAPDGKHFASASFDSTVRLWDAETHEQIGSPLEHGNEVYCVAYSPDGAFVISAGHEGKVFLWDIREMVKQHYMKNDLSKLNLSTPGNTGEGNREGNATPQSGPIASSPDTAAFDPAGATLYDESSNTQSKGDESHITSDKPGTGDGKSPGHKHNTSKSSVWRSMWDTIKNPFRCNKG